MGGGNQGDAGGRYQPEAHAVTEPLVFQLKGQGPTVDVESVEMFEGGAEAVGLISIRVAA
jgi:hypothetical protein